MNEYPVIGEELHRMGKSHTSEVWIQQATEAYRALVDDQQQRIKSLETTVLEQSDQIESLSAECERYRRVICDIETCKLVGELSDEIAGYLKLSDNLLVFVEWQAAKIERLTKALVSIREVEPGEYTDYAPREISLTCESCEAMQELARRHLAGEE